VESRLRIAGHPIQPVLVMFPLGLFVMALIFDAAHLLGGPALLGVVAYWNIGAGLIGGVLAALAGLIDLMFIPPNTRARRVGAANGLVNFGVLLFFTVILIVRMGDNRSAGGGLFVVELVALGAAVFAAWLGGELVDRLGAPAFARPVVGHRIF
jgi:uncharacterized membrane protein